MTGTDFSIHTTAERYVYFFALFQISKYRGPTTHVEIKEKKQVILRRDLGQRANNPFETKLSFNKLNHKLFYV